MANLDVSPMPGVRTLRLVRDITVRLGGRAGELLAAMLDVEPSRLRSEIAAVHPARRWIMAALIGSIGCSILGTTAAILYLLSETAAAQTEQDVLQPSPTSNDSYETIVMRPLFYRTRQASTAPAERPAPLALGDPQVTLKGIFINGDQAKAFIVSAGSPSGVWRKRGDEVAGWRIAEILSNRVVLESRAQQLVVPLTYANAR